VLGEETLEEIATKDMSQCWVGATPEKVHLKAKKSGAKPISLAEYFGIGQKFGIVQKRFGNVQPYNLSSSASKSVTFIL
jgi:hypothetical protein